MEEALEDMPAFGGAPLQGRIDAPYTLLYFRPLPGGPVKALAKRLICKLIKPVVLPMAEQQSAVNESLLRCLAELGEENRALSRRVRRLERALRERP